MSLMQWLHHKLGLDNTRADNTFRAAMIATNEVTTMARSLREQLQPYCHENDPFTAILRKNDMARQYDEGQVRDIHLGPPE